MRRVLLACVLVAAAADVRGQTLAAPVPGVVLLQGPAIFHPTTDHLSWQVADPTAFGPIEAVGVVAYIDNLPRMPVQWPPELPGDCDPVVAGLRWCRGLTPEMRAALSVPGRHTIALAYVQLATNQ